MDKITTKEARDKKDIAERAISDMVMQFEKETGLKVTGIGLCRDKKLGEIDLIWTHITAEVR